MIVPFLKQFIIYQEFALQKFLNDTNPDYREIGRRFHGDPLPRPHLAAGPVEFPGRNGE